MKTLFLTLLILVSTLFATAQRPRPCSEPMPDPVFRQKLKSITMLPTEDRKLHIANNIARNNCLSVEQIKEIAVLFIDDFDRLEFAKNAWANTIDRENFYFVYDEFAYFSTVFMLHDYVKAMENHGGEVPPVDPPFVLTFPAYNYPGYDNYRGPKNCNLPISEDEFLQAASHAAGSKSEARRMMMLTQITQNTCLSVSQTMKLASLIEQEPDRLSFFKTAVMSVYDLKNLPYGEQLFTTNQAKAAYTEFVKQTMHGTGPDIPPPPPCRVSSSDFTSIKASIEKESFNTTKVTLTKQILRSKQCFTTEQVSELLRLISFEDSKLELAKFAWDFTLDKENYYKIADVFTFSSSKESLMKFLEGKN